MTRYVAFLRAVNLGPTRKLAMARVRELLPASLGYPEVSTYIASGNVLFTVEGEGSGGPTAAERHAGAIRRVLSADAGFDVPTIVYSADDVAVVLAEQPFADADPRRVTVALLQGPVPATARTAVAALAETATGEEGVHAGSRALYLHLPHGTQGSKLAGAVAKALPDVTMRTLATVTRVAELLG